VAWDNRRQERLDAGKAQYSQRVAIKRAYREDFHTERAWACERGAADCPRGRKRKFWDGTRAGDGTLENGRSREWPMGEESKRKLRVKVGTSSHGRSCRNSGGVRGSNQERGTCDELRVPALSGPKCL